MKRACLLLIFALLLILAGTLLAGNVASKEDKSSGYKSPYRGKLQLSEDSFDFGIMPRGAKTSHKFVLTNAGRDSLEVIRIKPGCGCTKAPLTKRLLAPGESTDLEITFTAGNRRGKFAKFPMLYTSDPQVYETRLKIKGNLIYEDDPEFEHLVQLTPSSLAAAMGRMEDFYTVDVTNLSDEKLNLKLISYPDECLSIELPKGNIDPGETKPIKVKLKNLDDFKTYGFEKSFTIEFSDSENTRYTIPVRYSVRATMGGH